MAIIITKNEVLRKKYYEKKEHKNKLSFNKLWENVKWSEMSNWAPERGKSRKTYEETRAESYRYLMKIM